MREQFRHVLLVALVSFFGMSAGASAGTIVADSGFRPGVDGFSFPNYTNEDGYKNLNATEVQRIFGRTACLVGKGSTCVLTPAVRSWMDQANVAMGDGHCYGLSAVSLLVHSNKLPEFGYKAITDLGGGPPTFGLDIKDNRRLQGAIARAFVFQSFASVNEDAVEGTPKQIVDFLIKHLDDPTGETWNLSIFKFGFTDGHAITPYAVEDMGDGKFEIHVYDNNLPGNATRRVEVDTAKNTWNYYATTQPGYPQAEYLGNARSKTLRLSPNGPALGVQPCPYCVGRRAEKAKYNQISLTGRADQHGRVLITDSKGRQSGTLKGKLVNRIPGVQVLPQTSAGVSLAADGTPEPIQDSPTPIYLVPKNLKLKIKVDGRHMKVVDYETLGVVGPTFDSTVDRLKMGPGKVAYAKLSPKRQTLSVTTKGRRPPAVTFGAENRDAKAAYRVSAQALNAPSKSTVYFAKKPRLQLLRIGSKSRTKQAWQVMIDKFDNKGEETEYARTYRVRRGQAAFLHYGPLTSGKQARIVIVTAKGKRVRVLNLKELKD